MKDLSWKPILRGAIYCAPACGFNCTKAAFDAAQAKARLLALKLGAGWSPRVWENMGWHYTAGCNGAGWNMQVYPPKMRGDTYWVDLHVDDRQFHIHAKTAQAGIKAVLAEARKVAMAFDRAAKALPDFA